jgi:hypothetical protein
MILLISASEVARITGMSHRHPACSYVFENSLSEIHTETLIDGMLQRFASE